MTGFVSDGPIFAPPPEEADADYAATSSSWLQTLGAEAGQGINAFLARAAERGTQAGSSTLDQALAQYQVPGEAEAQAYGFAAPTPAPEQTPMLSAEEANQRFAPIGPDGQPVPIATAPMPEGLARIIGQQKTDALQRDGVIARYQDAHGLVMNALTGIVGSQLDPANFAANFVWPIGQGAMLGRLAEAGITGLAGRTLARAGAGALTGAVLQVPAIGIEAGLAPEEASTLSTADIVRQIGNGAASFAALHALGGALGDAAGAAWSAWLRQRNAAPAPDTPAPIVPGNEGPAPSLAEQAAPIVGASAATSRDALAAAVAQIGEGRPVDVAPIVTPEPTMTLGDVADRQARLYADGFAPGMPAAEFAAAQDRVLAKSTLARAPESGSALRGPGEAASAPGAARAPSIAAEAETATPAPSAGPSVGVAAPGEIAGASPSSFQTAKGSSYIVHDDGTTTRDKAYRPEHGEAEQGPQPRSEATFYVTAQDAERLGEFQAQGGPAKAVAPVGDGRWGVRYEDGADAGKFESRTVVPSESAPRVGLTPVETWDSGRRVHFGNEITAVSGAGTDRGVVSPAFPVRAVSAGPISSTVAAFRPDELRTDAARFQYKAGADAGGVTERLQGVERWDPTKAGLALVYDDGAGGKWIADGHQRRALAQRIADADPTQQPMLHAFVLRAADGVTPAEARVIAAAKNIAEGTGTAIDAAKILRDRPDLAADLPPRSELVKQARSLANLGDEPFGMVVNELVPPQYAAIVGRLAPHDARMQGALLDLLHKTEPENAVQAEAIVRQGLEAGTRTETQGELFGTREIASSLYLDRAKVLDRAIKQLRRDRRVFAALVDERDIAERLGNVLAHDTNLKRAATDAEAIHIVQTLASRRGSISDALGDAAGAARDTGNYAGAARDFVAELRRQAESGNLARLADGGSRGALDAGAEGARLAGAEPPEPLGLGGIAGPGAADRAGAEAQAIIAAETRGPSTRPVEDAGAQRVIPGAERITDRELAERQMAAPMRAEAPQRVADHGLFDETERGQQELFAADRDLAAAPTHLLGEEDRAELTRTEAALRDADDKARVAEAAGQCLKGGLL
jgi:hypothetical protein